MPRVKFTEEIERTICSYLRGGASPEQAAEAAGVPAEVFMRWLRWGKRSAGGRDRRYAEFRWRVRTAAAQARILAEMQVFGKDPRTWLRCGPGRDRTEEPGWTTTSPPRSLRRHQGHPLTDPAWASLWQRLLKVLADHPAARDAIVLALEEEECPPAQAAGSAP